MSKIEVNTVAPQCGTTLTLGESGDTVTLGCGASQTGFGRTGTVDWQTGDIKTGDFTAATGKGYFVNTTSGTITATLPASPTAGDIVGLKDYALTFDTNSMFIGRNSEPINGTTGTTVEISTEGATIMLVYVDGVKGWIPTQDDASAITAVTPAYIAATVSGACNTLATVCTDYKVATFVGPGTFCVSCVGNAVGSNAVSYVILAGGGEAGTTNPSNGSGGGGAGGYRESKAPSCSYTASPIAATGGFGVAATGYPIVVGGGGALQPNPGAAVANPGSVSSAFSLTAAGGGGGKGDIPGSDSPATVADGGSGGGGGAGSTGARVCGGTGNEPPVSPAQGTPGGNGLYGTIYAGGGGGGATVAGGTTSPTVAGAGGTGATTSIPATPTAYGGGGGGGRTSAGCGGVAGTGGGGTGGSAGSSGTSGTVNTGGGGGGGGWPSGSYNRGGGGSGVVIIRYKFQ